MSELFKDIYNQVFYQKFAGVVENVIEVFSTDAFINKIFVESFDGMELKARMAHTSSVLHYFWTMILTLLPSKLWQLLAH